MASIKEHKSSKEQMNEFLSLMLHRGKTSIFLLLTTTWRQTGIINEWRMKNLKCESAYLEAVFLELIQI